MIVFGACNDGRTMTEMARSRALDITPPSARLIEGGTMQLVAHDAQGAVVRNEELVWRSKNPSIASVSPAGVVTANSPGTVVLLASIGEVIGDSSTVTVIPPILPVERVEVNPATATIATDSTIQLSATVYAALDIELDGRTVTWTSRNTAIATVSSTGLVRGVWGGTVGIIANSEGKADTATITVLPPPVATVTVTPATATIKVDSTVQLTATLRASNGTVITGRSLLWFSLNTERATVSSTGQVRGVSGGTARVVATSEGKADTSTITVIDPPPPVASVTLTPSTANIEVDSTVQLTATLRDAAGIVLTGRTISWTSRNTAIATVSSSGLVTARAAGTVGIVATSEGRADTSSITVTNPVAPVASVTISPAAATILVDSTLQMSATMRDAGGTVLTGRVVTWTSLNAGRASVTVNGVVRGLAPGTARIVATSEARADTALITVSAPPVASVTLTPASATIQVDSIVQMTATLRDANGTVITGRVITWGSTDVTRATVSASGTVTGVAAGTARITATSEGRADTATITVTSPPPEPVASVTVTPSTASIEVDSTVQLTATMRDSNGNVLSGRAVTWTSTNPGRATVSASGRVTGVSAGTARVYATSEGRADTATITVTVPPVASVTVTPSSASIRVDSTVQLTATTRDANGTVLTGRTVTWTSRNTAVATVSATGLVTGQATGTVGIIANSEGRADTASITVTAAPPAPVATVSVTPATDTIMVDSTRQLTATMRDANGNVLTGRSVTWATLNPGRASVSSTGLVRGVGAGVARITATSEGVVDTARITVQEPPPAPVASVTVTPSTASIEVDSTVQLTATLRDANGNVLTGRTIAWTSSNTSRATVSGSGMVTGVTAGTVRITAASEGRADTATVTVTTSTQPVASVTVTPSTASIEIDSTVQLTATMRDANGNVLSGRAVTWATLNPGRATVSASGVVTGVAAGTARIYASSEGRADTATITVTAAPVASVTVTPSSASIRVDSTVQLTATTRDANGTVLTGRTVTWNSRNTAIATVSSTGLVTGQATGTVGIIATSEDRADTSSITVTAAPPAPVATVSVTPATDTILVDSTRQLTATMRDANGNVLTGRTVTWATLNPGRASVSSSGLVTGVGVGVARITATSEGVVDTARITVQDAPQAPVASVTVTPSTATIREDSTVQLTATVRDADGNVLTGRAVTWSSLNTGVASVTTAGLVRGVGPGTARIVGSAESRADTSTISVTAPPPPPPPPPGGQADPTLLPVASGQSPPSASYGRNISAGQTYADPVSGVTVLKLTDASTPVSNSGIDFGYSEGGPSISQPWTGSDGQTYYTLKVANRLVDLRYSTMTAVNWRSQPADGEIGFAFSLNPATPRIAYVVQNDRVDRYNTATNQVENTGNWPWIPTSGSSFQWLQNNLNDTWFVGMTYSNNSIHAFRPSDGFRRAITESQVGASMDEPHIDRELGWVYASVNSDGRANTSINLATGAVRVPNGVNCQADDHVSPVRGAMVGVGHWQCGNMYYYNVQTDQTILYPNVVGYPGDWHQAGQWVFGNGAGPAQWWIIDSCCGQSSGADVRNGMIAFVRAQPFSARIVAVHDSQVSGYDTFPMTTLAPDGKLIMWTSNQGGKSRMDVFVARIPTR